MPILTPTGLVSPRVVISSGPLYKLLVSALIASCRQSDFPCFKALTHAFIAIDICADFFNAASNALTGIIPTEFGLLASLRSLFLDENELFGEIPVEFGSLNSLGMCFL